jgi:hypothetical protein
MSIEKIFDNLEAWRNLPSYQLERRLDIFLSPHLGSILAGVLSNDDFKAAVIIPEFPLSQGWKGGTGSAPALSDKVDYLAIAGDQVAFVEFKTDQSSISGHQLDYLRKAWSMSFAEILSSIERQLHKTKSAHKYAFFLELLAKEGRVISGWPVAEYDDYLDKHGVDSASGQFTTAFLKSEHAKLHLKNSKLGEKSSDRWLVLIGPEGAGESVRKTENIKLVGDQFKFCSLKKAASLLDKGSEYESRLASLLELCDTQRPGLRKKRGAG